MSKLENDIKTVLRQLKAELAVETWESRRRYFDQMIRLANSLGINEPCQNLYNAYVSDDGGSKERRELHIRCVRLLDAVAGTEATDECGILYNEPPLPSEAEAKKYFDGKQYPLSERASIDHLITKAGMEMQYLNLTESTIAQYRHAWMDIRRYFHRNCCTEYDEQLLNQFISEIGQKRNDSSMKEWKWKINRKAALVLIEVANTGQFQWNVIGKGISCASTEVEAIRQQYLESLRHRNLSPATIALYDFVFRKLMEFAGAENENDLSSLSHVKIQLVIERLAGICNRRSMATILPVLRSILTFINVSGYIGKDLSGIVMSGFVQRGSVASYISKKDQLALARQIDLEPKRTKAIILLAVKLGLRDCDICNLTFQGIDWRNDRIRLLQEKTEEPITLPLLPDVGNALMDYILNERPKRADRYPYVFLRKQAPHNKLNTVYAICSNLLRKLEITPVNGHSMGVHVFRYTVAHNLLAAKVPHQVITDILGHVSKESDKPYLSMEESMLRLCALDLSIMGKVSWQGGACNG
jgi:integrase